ncbi:MULTISPECIES: hypothetical protein [Bacteroides]|jgi:hypothetical protein|nr:MULTISPECIES: hypothetical protein [Bacteroides]
MDILNDESLKISSFPTTLDELTNTIPYKTEGIRGKYRKSDRKGRFNIEN